SHLSRAGRHRSSSGAFETATPQKRLRLTFLSSPPNLRTRRTTFLLAASANLRRLVRRNIENDDHHRERNCAHTCSYGQHRKDHCSGARNSTCMPGLSPAWLLPACAAAMIFPVLSVPTCMRTISLPVMLIVFDIAALPSPHACTCR